MPADGRRVKKTTPWGTTYYIGEHYEKHIPAAGLSILPGDVNLDCQVSVADIQAIAARWGQAWSAQYDVDQDGSAIDAGDIQTAAANWRASAPSPCTGPVVTKYYRLGNRLIALRQNNQLRYIHTDHLGSVSLLTDANGKVVPGGVQRFMPFGKVRTGQPVILPTDRNFTRQQLDVSTGLLYYAGSQYGRYYDPVLGRWTQPDTVVPNPGNPQDLNRYSYTRDNPLRYTDPSGRMVDPGGATCGNCWEEMYRAYLEAAQRVDPQAYRGTLQEYIATKAVLYQNIVEGRPPEVIEAAETQVSNALMRLKINGFYGTDPAVETAWQAGGLEALPSTVAAIGGVVAGVVSPQIGQSSSGTGQKYVYRYVSEAEKEFIECEGIIQSTSGKTYLSPEQYRSATRAQQRLSLRDKPEYRVRIPRENLPLDVAEPTIVEEAYGQPGGGLEMRTTGPIDATGVQITRLKYK